MLYIIKRDGRRAKFNPENKKNRVLLFHGTNDDVVPPTSSEYVYNSVLSKKKEIVILKNTTHDIFRSEEIDKINKKIKDFFKTFIW